MKTLTKNDFKTLYKGMSETYIYQKFQAYKTLLSLKINPFNGFFDKETINKINKLKGMTNEKL